MSKFIIGILITVLSIIFAAVSTVVFIGLMDYNKRTVAKPNTEISVIGENTDSKIIVENTGTGFSVVTDKLTGCEYISNSSGITPRMYSDGIQVCGQSTYPNDWDHGE